MNADGELNILVIVAAVLGVVVNLRDDPVPQHTSVLTGQLYFNEVMETFNVHRFHQVARMDRETFVKLRSLLVETGGLKNSLYICVGQKIMILLHVIRGYTIRETMERWQHSGSTISKVVHEASEALLNCRTLIFQPALLGAPVPIQIANFAKFSPFFDNCIGALDGTFIPACIPLAEQQPFIDRKKNVFSECSWSSEFRSYICFWSFWLRGVRTR